MRSRLLPLLLAMTTTCIITNPTDYSTEPLLTPPRIRDVPQLTRPRLGNLVELRETDRSVVFEVPVDDTGVRDDLEWQLFVNVERECSTLEASCRPVERGTISSNGTTRRLVEVTIPEVAFATGCNRVELWVSSDFNFDGDVHIPEQANDVDFASWWVFKRAREGSADGGVVDPVESCAHRVSQ
jgi:hypothetical protein